MKRTLLSFLAGILLIPAAHAEQGSLWNGNWKYDASHSLPGPKQEAAPGYHLAIEPDGRITWEVPALHEMVTGKTDGQAMVVHRPGAAKGLTLAVRQEGPTVLVYRVAVEGKAVGEGRMTLLNGGKVFLDVSWPMGRPQQATELVYVRQ
jgi:hypothetical protein